MKVEFDPAKDAINLARHGVSLAFGAAVFDDPAHLILPTTRIEDNEDRYKAIGQVAGKLWTAIHVYRGDMIRLISVRRSNQNEERLFNRNSC